MQMKRQLRNMGLAIMIGGVAAASLSAQTLGRKSIDRTTVIDEAGSYVLVTDLSLSSNSTADAAIMITASGVTLDLNGHQITGPGGLQGVGVLIDGAESVTVRNGHIANMFIGVRVAGSSNVKLNDLHIRGLDIGVSAPPPEIGVMIAQSRNVEVEDLNISKTGLGIFVRGGQSTGNRIANNTISAGDNGVFAICYNPTGDDTEGPRGDVISGNLLSGFIVGINLVPTAGYNVIRDNTIAYKSSAWESPNTTNVFDGNVEMALLN